MPFLSLPYDFILLSQEMSDYWQPNQLGRGGKTNLLLDPEYAATYYNI